MYLTKVVETYRIANEREVEAFLSELKKDKRFVVAKYSSTKKEKKSKGEVIDEYIRFEVTKLFNDEAEPDSIIDVDYKISTVYSTQEDEYDDNEF